jgi:hypothetical protein
MRGVPLGGEEVSRTTGVRFVLTVYLLSRAFYLVVGSVLARVVPVGGFHGSAADALPGGMNIWSHWDGEHYVELAAGGYLHPPAEVSPAFFPVYPLLVRGASDLFGGPLSRQSLSLSGTLVSLVLLPFAFYFIYQLAHQLGGASVARSSVLALAVFPTAFFLNAAYTESLFLALSAGALWAMRVRRNLLLACVLAGCAAATRNVGVFLAVPLLYEWIAAGGLADRRGRWRGLYLALAPSGLVLYMAYLGLRFGNPLLFYTAQQDWGRESSGPITTAARAWRSASEGAATLQDNRLWTQPSVESLTHHFAAASGFYDLALLVVAVVVLLATARRMPVSLSLYAFLVIIPATLFGTPESPLMGTPRYLLAAFPLFIGFGLLSSRKILFAGWLGVSVVLSVVLCGLFVGWWYVA